MNGSATQRRALKPRALNLSGAIPDELDEGKTQREMLLPEAIIHGGLPPSPAYDTHMDEAIMATAESVLA